MMKQLSGALASLAAALALVLSLGAGPGQAQDAGYVLRPGDVLQVEVIEDPSLNRSTLVLPNGSITFPQAGTLAAGGRTPDQVREALTSALAPSFAAPPTVFVSVASVAVPELLPPGVAAGPAIVPTMDIYVLGEVGAPGLKQVDPDTNILQFLAVAGALSRFAADNRIELHRKDPSGRLVVYRFDLDNVGGGAGSISGLTPLTEGDVIVVPQRKLFE
jgi:polysaccharide biosynthesis/export protein